MQTLIFGILGGAAIIAGLYRFRMFPMVGLIIIALGLFCINVATWGM